MRSGSEGKLARWVGENYLDIKKQDPAASEKSIRIDIARRRYPDLDFDSSVEISDGEKDNFFLINRVVKSEDLNDVVVALFRYEVGNGYENDEDKMRLMYSVIFEELIELGIPRSIAMQGQ